MKIHNIYIYIYIYIQQMDPINPVNPHPAKKQATLYNIYLKSIKSTAELESHLRVHEGGINY